MPHILTASPSHPPESLGGRWAWLFLAALLTYPYVFALNWFVPATLPFGKNAYVAFETLAVAIVFAAFLPRIVRPLGLVLALVTLAAFSVILLRALLYDEALGSLLFALRLPFMFMLYASTAWAVMMDPSKRPIVQSIVIVNSFVQALFGIVHDIWFSHFLTGPNVSLMGGGDRLWFLAPPGTRFRETGALVSASLYANFIVLGMLVVVFAPRREKRAFDRRWLVETIALAVMMYGLSLSGSRFPIVTAMLLFVIHLLRHLSVRALIPVAGALAVGALLMLPFALNVMNRFSVEGTGGRLIKAELGWHLLTETPARLLLGAPLVAQDAAISGTLTLSDNSIYALLLLLGPPAALVFAAGVVAMLALTTRVKWHGPVLLYLAGVLILTNGIYWDIWVLYCFATLYSMQPWREPLRPRYHAQ